MAIKLMKNKGGEIYVNLTQRKCAYKSKGKEFPIELEPVEKISIEEVMENIEGLYDTYFNSNTTEYDKVQTYFVAKPFDELTDEDRCFGQDRREARANLELYVLENIFAGNFKNWNFGYFWVSEKYPKLIIKRKWIKGE